MAQILTDRMCAALALAAKKKGRHMTAASIVVDALKTDWLFEASVYSLLALALLLLDFHDLTFLLDALGDAQATEVLQAALLQ